MNTLTIDHFNPRLWLRDWLCRKSKGELVREAANDQKYRESVSGYRGLQDGGQSLHTRSIAPYKAFSVWVESA